MHRLPVFALTCALLGTAIEPAAAQSTPPTLPKSSWTKPGAARPSAAVALPATGQGGGQAFLVNGSDLCATPDAISGPGPFAFDNTTATTGAQGQAEALCNFFGSTGIASDVWFAWTAGFTGTAVLSTCSQTGVDTKIAVYAGAGCPTGAALACNDDACAFQTEVTFLVTSGQVYTAQLGLYPLGAAPGAGTFTITQQVTTLPNDECTGALPISGIGPHSYDTSLATTGIAGQTNARCFIYNASAISRDLWYVWTSGTTGWVAVDACLGGMHDMKIAVYAGAGCPSAEPLVCDDDACGVVGGNARAPFFATAGSQYLIQLGSYIGSAGSLGSFMVGPFTPAVGDDCNAPIAISGIGPFAWDNTMATTGFEGQHDPLCSGELISYDLWYSWTAFCAGSTSVTLCTTTAWDTKIAVYAGGGCPTGSPLGCDDDGCAPGGPSIVTFNAVLGQTYLIQIGLWPGEAPGSGGFLITAPCPPPTGTPYCSGDGSGTACPCGNSGAADSGCASSVSASGGKLSGTGNPSIGADTLILLGSQMPNSSALYFQGTSALAGGAGAVFGDGLRCVGGTIMRLGTKSNVAGASQYPQAGNLPVSVRGGVAAPGTRYYQVWYRNAAVFCTTATFNLTNGLRIDWL